jgi:hypothetical protein
MKNLIIALKNDTLRHFFLMQNACKNEPQWHFFNASWPIKKSYFMNVNK